MHPLCTPCARQSTTMRAIDLLDHGLLQAPERGYIRDATTRYSHADARVLSHRIANALHAAGVRRGSRVAFYSPNSAIAFVALIGVLRAGAVWQPVHLRNPLPENIDFLRENGCAFLFYHSKHAGDVAAIKAAVGSLKGARCLDEASEDGTAVESWASAFPDIFPDDDHGAEDLAWIKATGGTTGRPKTVMICHRNVQALFATFRMCMPLPEGHVNLRRAPDDPRRRQHRAVGAVGRRQPRDDGARRSGCDRAGDCGASRDHDVPAADGDLLDAGPAGRTRCGLFVVALFLYTGAPMSSDKLKEALDVFGRVMTQTWGQTEAPLICTYLGPEEHVDVDGANARILRSCGRASPLTRVEVMDEAGRMLGPGEVGELVVRGDLVMKGYFERPEENEKASRFGWHHTGDVGYRNEDGLFFIVDRNKDMIISGGFNIYPSEIEQVLWRHPSVLDCAVIGVPDVKWARPSKRSSS